MAKHFKIGDRAKFTGKDRVFHNGEREGHEGTIVLDANGDPRSNFGDGTCYWQVDGDPGLYLTGFEDLTEVCEMAENSTEEKLRTSVFEDTPEFFLALSKRFVQNCRPRRHMPRWAVVSERCGHGSTYSIAICRYFGLDPDGTFHSK